MEKKFKSLLDKMFSLKMIRMDREQYKALVHLLQIQRLKFFFLQRRKLYVYLSLFMNLKYIPIVIKQYRNIKTKASNENFLGFLYICGTE